MDFYKLIFQWGFTPNTNYQKENTFDIPFKEGHTHKKAELK